MFRAKCDWCWGPGEPTPPAGSRKNRAMHVNREPTRFALPRPAEVIAKHPTALSQMSPPMPRPPMLVGSLLWAMRPRAK